MPDSEVLLQNLTTTLAIPQWPPVSAHGLVLNNRGFLKLSEPGEELLYLFLKKLIRPCHRNIQLSFRIVCHGGGAHSSQGTRSVHSTQHLT